MIYRVFILLAAVLVLGTGCSDQKAPDPPTARAELTVRLYETLNAKRYEEALAIADKLLALDSNDADLMEMRDRIIGNIAAVKVQQYIDHGQLEKAYTYIREERKRYPAMPRLRIMEEDINNLTTLRDSARNLAKAKTIPELANALELIVPQAAKYPAAQQLHKDIAQQQKRLKKMREDAAASVEKAAAKAVEQSALPVQNTKR